MAPLYDLMLMLDPNAPEDRQAAIIREVQGAIESRGELVGSHDWGTRRLAYEIDHRPEGGYHLFQFNAERGLLNELDRTLKITDGVLRFRIIRLKPGSPPPPTPRPERSRPREAEGAPVAARAAADAPSEEPGG